MPAEEFVRRIRLSARQQDTHYAFWIGAGCSISSGIPGAAALVADRWLPQLQRIRGAAHLDLQEWAISEFPDYRSDDPAALYGSVMEALFIHPEARQREVEELCDGRFPGFGYAVLAALLGRDDGLFNVALTTNFDDLIADAMYVFTEARPLVIPDESLAGYIRPTRLRPLVIKVHGDHRLSPRNTRTETETLKKGIAEGIGNLLHDRGVIFVGYGGNDQGIAEVLNSLPPQALPLGIWWASATEPEGVLRHWLEKRHAIWIDSPGFDELMLLFQNEFDIPQPNYKKFERVFAGYLDTYKKLEKRVERIPDSDPEASSLKDAAANVEAAARDWPAVLLQATRIEEHEPERAEELYVSGIDQFPEAGLLKAEYAQFLMWRGRSKEALEMVEKALDADPENVNLLRLKAHALGASGDLEQALEILGRAVDLAPRNLMVHGLYGMYLLMSGDRNGAEQQLEIMLELQPSEAVELALVAVLLDDLGEHERASAFHQKAIQGLPENANARANFARCLIAMGQRDEALEQTNTALDLMPIAVRPARLEALFYAFVLDPERQNDGLAALKREIAGGVRASDWVFSDVVAFGEATVHPDSRWLQPLAEVIGAKREAKTLEPWQRWSEIDV
jgi:tetratricopeptide (TPR) repeat protein